MHDVTFKPPPRRLGLAWLGFLIAPQFALNPAEISVNCWTMVARKHAISNCKLIFANKHAELIKPELWATWLCYVMGGNGVWGRCRNRNMREMRTRFADLWATKDKDNDIQIPIGTSGPHIRPVSFRAPISPALLSDVDDDPTPTKISSKTSIAKGFIFT